MPGEIAIGGFDDIPMAPYVVPALTSVHVDISALGERAAARLLLRLQDPDSDHPRRETVATTLVVRQSSGVKQS